MKPKYTYAGSRAAEVGLRAGNAFPMSQYIVAQIEVSLHSHCHCPAEVFFCSENTTIGMAPTWISASEATAINLT